MADFLCSYTDELYCEFATEKAKKARQAEVDLIGNNDLLLDDEMTD